MDVTGISPSKNPPAAFREIHRVLRPASYLVIRNGTRENNEELTWIHCFPEAQQIEEAISPSQNDILDSVCRAGFDSIAVQTVYQIFAYSYTEYYDKISQRGLSTLLSISDDAFSAGLERLRQWAGQQQTDQPVKEPVDLFVFRMSN